MKTRGSSCAMRPNCTDQASHTVVGALLVGAVMASCATVSDLPAGLDDISDVAEDSPESETDAEDEGSDSTSDDAGIDDSVPVPACGNGLIEGAEACDNGSANSDTNADACRTDCVLPRCGDGVLDGGEACDEGPSPGAFCTSACRRVETDLCEPCDNDDACGAELDGCVALEDGGNCGLACQSGRDCPEGFLCSDVLSFAGAPIRHCVPTSGVCVDCFDPDRDGFGSGSGCVDTDCDQSDPLIRPGAQESCDGVDNNCDGRVDEGSEQSTWHIDFDGDGYGERGSPPRFDCRTLVGYAANDLDCNDRNRLVYGGAPELCDRIDNNCNGAVDEGTADLSFYIDADDDGYGDRSAAAVLTCSPPGGYVTNRLDCNDTRDAVNPGVSEQCSNGVDDNCDGGVDCADTACASLPVCRSGCIDDRLEDNDTREQSSSLSGVVRDLVSCEGDSDWFVVSLTSGDDVRFTMTFAHANGDIDMSLTDEFGRLVASSAGVVDVEEITFVVEESGEYFLRVYLFEDAGEAGSSYALEFTRE